MTVRSPWGPPPDPPNELLPAQHIAWHQRCQHIGGCITNKQLDPERCVYCGKGTK